MMWSIRFRLITNGLILSLLIWFIIIGLSHILGADLADVGLGASLFTCYLTNMHANLPSFLRTICPSLSKAWLEYLLSISAFVVPNLAIYLFIRSGTFSQQLVLNPFESIFYSKLGFCWLFLCVLQVFILTRNPKLALEPLTKKILAKRFVKLLLLYIVLILLAVFFALSPLVAMTAASLIFCLLWNWDYFARTSIPSRLRAKIIAGGMIAVVLAGLVSYKIGVETGNTAFLGHLISREPNWKQAAEIKTVDEWARWYTSTDTSKTIDQTILSYIQLESLCQSKHSDNVAELVCEGETENSFNINEHWKSDDILKLLSSESILVNKIGLLQARMLAPPSEDLRSLISKVATKSPALAFLAENTLSLKLPQKEPRQLHVIITKKNILSAIKEN